MRSPAICAGGGRNGADRAASSQSTAPGPNPRSVAVVGSAAVGATTTGSLGTPGPMAKWPSRARTRALAYVGLA